ncbi:MAG: hypothetical protein N3B13_06290, partial [Deltaproteobacteria bacterium]|nr:hypothetical protein [Deltaproteobacteria bacterium]
MKKYLYISCLVLISVITSTCGPEDFYITIAGVRPPEEDCTYKPGEVFLAWGTADATLITTIHNYGYVAALQVENRLLNTKDVTKKPGSMDDLPMRTDTNIVVMKKAVVNLRGVVASNNTMTTTKYKSTYNMEISETVIPSAGDDKTPGKAIVLLSLVPKEKLIQLEDSLGEWPTDPSTYVDMIAEVHLEGETLGGISVKSNKFNFYIRFCYG